MMMRQRQVQNMPKHSLQQPFRRNPSVATDEQMRSQGTAQFQMLH